MMPTTTPPPIRRRRVLLAMLAWLLVGVASTTWLFAYQRPMRREPAAGSGPRWDVTTMGVSIMTTTPRAEYVVPQGRVVLGRVTVNPPQGGPAVTARLERRVDIPLDPSEADARADELPSNPKWLALRQVEELRVAFLEEAARRAALDRVLLGRLSDDPWPRPLVRAFALPWVWAGTDLGLTTDDGKPYRLYAVLVPHWLIALVLLLVATRLTWPLLRRVPVGRCVGCGYDLRGSAGGCPECGLGRADGRDAGG